MCFQYGLQSKRIFTKAILAISLLSLSAYSQDTLNITDLEKDANGNYLTPDAPIVQSLPEYNKDMKAGDLFRYSNMKYPIWGELLDASEYNYIQPYRHGHCQYDASVWEPVANKYDWTQLPPCIRQMFIASDAFYGKNPIEAKPYPNFKGSQFKIHMDTALGDDEAISLLTSDFINSLKKFDITTVKSNLYKDGANIYMISANRGEDTYFNFLNDISQKTLSVKNIPSQNMFAILQAGVNIAENLSDHIGGYSDEITASFFSVLDDKKRKNLVTDNTPYLFIMTFDTESLGDIFKLNNFKILEFINYEPFTSAQYWEKMPDLPLLPFIEVFSSYSTYFIFQFGAGRYDYSGIQDPWNNGMWQYEPLGRYLITMTPEGRLLVPDFILEGLKYIEPLE